MKKNKTIIILIAFCLIVSSRTAFGFNDGNFIMNKICGIYKITSPNKKVYIGQSINIYSRWKGYKRLECKKQVRLYNSFKKYGIKKHKFEILQQCEREQLNEFEKYYVDLYQCFNSEFGLNLRDGGGNHIKMSEESRKKMSIAQKGKHLSEETKHKISESHKGIIPYNKGCKISEETKKK